MKENSIKEDITRIKQRIEDVKEYIEYGLSYSEYLDLENSFDNILSDYKRVLKENEELEEINNELEAEKNEAIRRYNFETIPKQKVKDKIKEILNNGEYRIIFEGDADFPDEATCIDAQKYIKLEKLQELLEGRKI